MKQTDVDRARQVVARALIRMEDGQNTYGVFNPGTDKRDLFEWAIEELLDTINYCAMQVLKLEAMREEIGKCMGTTEKGT